MKKRHLAFALLSVLVLPLTSCDYILRFFGSDSEWLFPIGGSSSSEEPSSRTPSSDVSTPPADEISANSASCNYSDLVENSVYPISSTPSKGTAKIWSFQFGLPIPLISLHPTKEKMFVAILKRFILVAPVILDGTALNHIMKKRAWVL